MEILFLIGRIIFGGYFIYSGINHFKNTDGLTHYASSKGVPFAKYAVYITGVLLLFGGAGFILGVFVRYAIFALVLFLIPVTFIMHPFWKVNDPIQKTLEMINFTKNMALLGAVLLALGVLEPWALSLSF